LGGCSGGGENKKKKEKETYSIVPRL